MSTHSTGDFRIEKDPKSQLGSAPQADHPTPSSIYKWGNTIGYADGNDCSRSSSFSSVKEDGEDVAQSFLVSRRSKDQLAPKGFGNEANCWTVRGDRLSDNLWFDELGLIEEDAVSLEDLSLSSLETETAGDLAKKTDVSHAGESPFEQLPAELLELILEKLTLDVPPQEVVPRNTDLVACLLTSKTVNAVAENVLYRQITLPHSYVFSKFFKHLCANPDLGRLVRRFDLSHFSSVGLGRTKEMDLQIQNLSAEALLSSLKLMPNVKELLFQEHLDHDIDQAVLQKVFYELPKLRSLDFCACYVGSFADSFSSALTPLWSQPNMELSIENLSLHECFTLRGSDLELLLPHLPRLTILDLYHTRVTDRALHAIRGTAKLTHLNLGHCNNITGPAVVNFLAEHPAAKNIVYLNLSCDTSRYRLLRFTELDKLLPILPSTLRSLNLGGAQLDPPRHMPHLRDMTKHLEEIGLGSTNLSIADVKSLFLPGKTPDAVPNGPSESLCTLRYMDLSSNPGITQPSLFFDASQSTSRIDAGMTSPTPFLLKDACPLEVIELGAPVLGDLKKMDKTNKRFGWLVKELGRRGWYVRERGSVAAGTEDPAGGRMRGERWWKMGCRSWGMKKVPVVRGHVGGLYGHCMFKK